MKKLFNFRLLVLIGVLIMSVNQMWARTYSGEEILYIKNIKPGGWGDTWCSSKVWVTFDNGSTNYEGLKLEGSDNTVGTLYAVQVPNGTYTSVTIYRGSTVGNSWNKTGKITLDASKNCITSYSENSTSASWENVDLFNNGSVMYLIRGWDWNQGNERYAAYFFDGQHSAWVSLTNHSGDIYKCTIPTRKWARIIMCRMNGANNTNNWDNKWYQTTNISPSGTGNCVYITGNSSDGNAHDNWRLGKYAPTPAIAGDMNSWSPTANQFSGTPKRLKMDLPAGKAYNFKLANGEDNDWYGSGTTDNDLTFVGQTNSETLTTRKNNVMLLTAEAGEYTFEWSGTALTITYPSTSHPSMNYVYMPKFGDWNSGNYCYMHYFYGDGGEGKTLTTWGTNDLKIKSTVSINGSNYYMFPILETYVKFVAKNNIGNESDGHKTDDMTTTGNGGKYTEYITSAWGWRNWSFTVTLDEQATCVSAPENPTVQFNGTALSNSAGAVTIPVRTGYIFGGYYNTSTCNDLQIITNTGAWQGSKSGYTDASRKWIHQGGAATLYAKWTAKTYDLTFDDEGATTAGGNSKRTVTYDASTNLSVVTCPQREGYTFNGYWTTASGEGVQIFAANGSLVSNVAGYITSGTWTHDDDVELHARWTDDGTYYFDGNGGESTAWATAANWTKGAVPGSTSDVIILKPVVVTTGTTKTVNSIKIATEGSYTPNGGSAIEAAGKLTIPAEAMLKVTTSVQNYDLSTSTVSATTAATLHIEAGNTSTAGNGALVWGTSGTPGEAQVDFCTKSGGVKNSSEAINQYIGTPFSNEQSILYQYYYSWMFKIKRTSGVLSWDLMAGDESMNAFEGYNLITGYDAGTTYQMEGTLVSNADVTLNSSSTPALVYTTGTGSNPNNENVLANSWVAPIKIKNMNVSGVFTNIDASIYIFNAGSATDAGKGGLAGNYSTYTVNSAADTDVIPSMQSFSVYANAASPVLFLDYSEIVQKDASNSLIVPNMAPQRANETAEEMDALKIRVQGENGWADELKIFIHDDFSNIFENGWDAHKMYGYPQAPQLYAMTVDGNMAINCVPTADNNVIGFTPGSEDNEYTFSFTYGGDEEYYLKDTKLNIETQINAEATYTFTSEAEDSDMRFMIIKHAPAVATGAEAVSGDQLAVSGVQKIMHNGQLYIIRDGGIYDATGAMVK